MSIPVSWAMNVVPQIKVQATKQINDFSQDWEFRHFPKIDIKEDYTRDDFMYPDTLPIGKAINGDESVTPGLRLKHETCNELHRYFEDLQGQAWNLSPYYRAADNKTKYAIRQLNNLCHEIEGWVASNRKKIVVNNNSTKELAVIGSGDVLSGIIASLVGEKKLNSFEASCAGVWIHSEIGKKSGIGLIAEDLIKQLKPTLKKLYGRFVKQRTRKKS